MIVAQLLDRNEYSQFFGLMDDNEFRTFNDFKYDEVLTAWNSENKRRRKLKEQEQERIREMQFEAEQNRKQAIPYSEALAMEICERIASGELLTCICLDEHMPTVRRCTQWIGRHTDFSALYNQAVNERLDIFEEQLIEIANSSAKDLEIVQTKGSVRKVLDPAKVTAAKLRIEVRRMHLRACRPQKWGETSTVITKSDDGFNAADLSPEDLEKKIAELDAKQRTVNSANNDTKPDLFSAA